MLGPSETPSGRNASADSRREESVPPRSGTDEIDDGEEPTHLRDAIAESQAELLEPPEDDGPEEDSPNTRIRMSRRMRKYLAGGQSDEES